MFEQQINIAWGSGNFDLIEQIGKALLQFIGNEAVFFDLQAIEINQPQQLDRQVILLISIYSRND